MGSVKRREAGRIKGCRSALYTAVFPWGGLDGHGGGSFQNYEISYVKTHSSGAGVCVCVHAAI